jgi:hypothetical protein
MATSMLGGRKKGEEKVGDGCWLPLLIGWAFALLCRNAGRISAKMQQGMLTLTLPKSERVKPRKIAVAD